MHKRVVLVVSLLWLGVLVPSAGWAQSGSSRCSTGGQVSDLSNIDLEALLNTRIITASRFSGTTAYFTDRSMVAARGDQTKIDGGHILLLVNGRPTREILEGGVISDVLESFPIDALDHIEVVRGPGSVCTGPTRSRPSST